MPPNEFESPPNESPSFAASSARGSTPHELLTEEEAADVMRSDTGHVRRLVRQRRLAVVRDGHWIRIPLADIEQFLERARIEAEGAFIAELRDYPTSA